MCSTTQREYRPIKLTRPFLVVGLPRSRTCWLSTFLTYGGRRCEHEPSLLWTDHEDLKAWLTLRQGASDSMMTWLAHEAKRLWPTLAIVVVRRNLTDVLQSISKLPYEPSAYLPDYLRRLDERLDQIEDDLGCYSVSFDSLDSPTVCGAIFSKCLDEHMPVAWWERWRDKNVQADIPNTLRVLRENEAGVRAVYGERHWEMWG